MHQPGTPLQALNNGAAGDRSATVTPVFQRDQGVADGGQLCDLAAEVFDPASGTPTHFGTRSASPAR